MTMLTRVNLFFCAAIFSAALFAATATHSSSTESTEKSVPTMLMGMMIQPEKTATTFTFILSKKAETKIWQTPDAKQVVIEFTNTTPKYSIDNARLGSAYVQKINTQRMPTGNLQYLFTVPGKSHWTTHYLPTDERVKGVRLQLKIMQAAAKH